MRAIAEEAAVLVRRYHGAYSGEHGDGLCRGEWIAWQFGAELYQAFRAIKHELDPLGLFNPDKIIDPPKMDEVALLRFAAALGAASLSHASADARARLVGLERAERSAHGKISPPGSGGDHTGGFAKAVEMCNNNGHCRQFDAGTMCPSFPRHARRAACDARPGQHLATGALGPTRRGCA